MIKVLTFLFSLLTLQVFSQTNDNNDPVFNSITLKEDTFKDFQLLSNYYTLKNNINNRSSSVYIADKPTLDDIENAAINLPSDFFIILKNQSVINLILIRNSPSREYFIIDPGTGAQKEFPCEIKGDITENRANEIIKEGFDSKAEIKDGKLFFNNKTLTIAYNKNIKENILKIINEQNLTEGDTSNVKVLSKEDLRTIVLTESKEGGKLDFFTGIKGHEYDGVQIKPGLFTTKLGIALYKWGRGNFELGVNNIDDALEFWSELKERQANQREKDYITKGFNKELEK
ncbi:MAG TPA: hypothetical protein VFW07_21570 [Parafilimonas sp.]|nr:hypothetical protein [Parafilimonas sp.]